jgi:Tfp pilus assembly pilus retraction ATPase PilT
VPTAVATRRREGTQGLAALIATGEMWGMQTFDQSLANLYERGLVTREDALAHAAYAPGLMIRLDDADRVGPGTPIGVG